MPATLAPHVVEAAQRAVAATLPNDAARNDAAEKFVASISSNDTKEDASTRVKELSEKIRAIRGNMITVASTLVEFDAAGYKDKDGNKIELGPKWRVLIQEYNGCVQYSLEAATGAAVFLKNLTQVLGDVAVGDDANDLLDELENFTQHAKREADAVHQGEDKLQKFEINMARFSAELSIALEKVSEPIKANVDRCIAKLKQLLQQLKELDEKINALSAAYVSQIATGANGVCAAIATLAPLAVLNAIGTNSEIGIALKEVMDERERIMRQIAATEKELVALYDQIEPLQKYKVEVDKTRFAVSRVVPAGRILIALWLNIATDVDALTQSVRDRLAYGVGITKMFMIVIQHNRELFSSFIPLLETYLGETRVAST